MNNISDISNNDRIGRKLKFLLVDIKMIIFFSKNVKLQFFIKIRKYFMILIIIIIHLQVVKIKNPCTFVQGFVDFRLCSLALVKLTFILLLLNK